MAVSNPVLPLDDRFANLRYEDFRRLAAQPELSKYEKIGFPDAYRASYEGYIFEDIVSKLPLLSERGLTVLDIGPGCSDLPRMLIDCCGRQGHRLGLVDSPEMLTLLPNEPFVEKITGMFPTNAVAVAERIGGADIILSYSVLQYAFLDTSVWNFLDQTLLLLRPGGQMMLGDIPNASKRKRFLSSAHGSAHHRHLTGSTQAPPVVFNRPEPGQIDDAVILGLLARARAAGVDAYVIPQDERLPMANRREDMLLRRP